MRAVVLLVIGLACRSSAPPLFAAGSKEDDGHGALARASSQLLTDEEDVFASSARRPVEIDELGASVGGSAYGGTSHATDAVPTWVAPTVERKPKFAQVEGLAGAIEGVVTSRGATKLATPCGEVEVAARPLVYIERVQVGRTLPYDAKPASVGGLIVKRGCTLAPAVQIATPLPAAVAIHGDQRAARLRVTPPVGAARTHELQEGGRVALQVAAGVTRVEGDDGSLGAAWVVALDAPYYAIVDDRGRFRLDELATGSYEVTIWLPPTPALANGVLTYGAPIVMHRTVTVPSSGSARLDVAIGR